ncbi:MAG: hypothetical protein Q8R44_19420 [Novosphingobium sp.]|nr:hypothetical protein [Novosphingobium sp.]
MKKLLPVCLVLALSACAPGQGGPRDRLIRAFAEPGLVIATERAFARMAREKGTWTAFRHHATKDALWPTPALANVHQALKGTPDPAQPILWGPDAAWSSCDGSFAVTTGEAAYPDGRKSRFLTVWQRQDSGEYRWVLDQGFDSAGGAIDPETIPAKVAECPKGPRPSRRVRRGEAWGSAAANDGTLAWETTIAPDCSRTAVVRMAGAGGMGEVFRKTASQPQAPAGQSPPKCG